MTAPKRRERRKHVMTDDCWCEPESQPVKCRDGSVDWVVVHNRHAGPRCEVCDDLDARDLAAARPADPDRGEAS